MDFDYRRGDVDVARQDVVSTYVIKVRGAQDRPFSTPFTQVSIRVFISVNEDVQFFLDFFVFIPLSDVVRRVRIAACVFCTSVLV